MSASPKQCKLIHDLMAAGAPIPEHPQFDRPDDTMFHSVEAADKYIKQHYHVLARKASMDAISKRISATDWGGIPNH